MAKSGKCSPTWYHQRLVYASRQGDIELSFCPLEKWKSSSWQTWSLLCPWNLNGPRSLSSFCVSAFWPNGWMPVCLLSSTATCVRPVLVRLRPWSVEPLFVKMITSDRLCSLAAVGRTWNRCSLCVPMPAFQLRPFRTWFSSPNSGQRPTIVFWSCSVLAFIRKALFAIRISKAGFRSGFNTNSLALRSSVPSVDCI